MRAVRTVGASYRDGEGVSESTDKAIEYYTKGSDAGVETCSYYLGLNYAEEGPHQDHKKAVRYMKVAMHQRSYGAFSSLGLWYINGKCGLPVDTAKGVALITEAADRGLLMAQANLGEFYCFGSHGIGRSLPLALKYLKLAVTELQIKDEGYLMNLPAPLSDEDRYYFICRIAGCYTDDPGPSLPDSYYWLNRYLSTHSPSCRGCDMEERAREKVDEIKKHLASHCSTCKKEREGVRPLDTCSRCYLARYCSKECQREHWVSHKEICKMIKGVL